MKIVIIVGLPCSGKIHLGCELVQNGGHFINDISKQGIASKQGITILDNVPNTDLLVISDPFLCRLNDRILAERVIESRFSTSQIEWIYFENSPAKCLKNMDLRLKRGDRVLDICRLHYLIQSLSKQYIIPQGVKTKPIYEALES